MFKTVTWSTYFSYVALGCLAWYLFVAIRYYRYEIGAFARRIHTPNSKATIPDAAGEPRSMPSDNGAPTTELPTANMEADVASFASKLEEVVRESSAKGYGREEFFFLLQLTLKEFPVLDLPGCRPAVRSLIVSECDKAGYLVPESDELDKLWQQIAA